MSDESPARVPQPADSPGILRLLALIAVAAGVLLLAAAAFVLSYAGIHAVALSAGVSPRLARIYPLIFDAMLVVACAAVLALRGAGLPSRVYAWLSMLVLLAAAAAADALHATGTKLPQRPAAAAAAVIPWVLVLIGFGLLLSMLRQARLRRVAAAAARQAEIPEPEPSSLIVVRHGIDSAPRAATRPSGELVQPGVLPAGDAARPGMPSGPDAAQPVEAFRAAAPDPALDLAIDAEPGQDDPVSDEAGPADPLVTPQVPRARVAEQPAGYGGTLSASAFSPAPTVDVASAAEADIAIPASAFRNPAPGNPTFTVPAPAGSVPARWAATAPAGTAPARGAATATAAAPGGTALSGLASGGGPVPQGGQADDPELDRGPAADIGSEPGAKVGLWLDPEADLDPDAGPYAEAELDVEAEPGSGAPLPFDRMRSSPIPPAASAP